MNCTSRFIDWNEKEASVFADYSNKESWLAWVYSRDIECNLLLAGKDASVPEEYRGEIGMGNKKARKSTSNVEKVLADMAGHSKLIGEALQNINKPSKECDPQEKASKQHILFEKLLSNISSIETRIVAVQNGGANEAVKEKRVAALNKALGKCYDDLSAVE